MILLRNAKKKIKLGKKLIRWHKRDLVNKIKYGSCAPLTCEKLLVDPRNIDCVINSGLLNRGDTGRVIGGDWDLQTSSIFSLPKIKICFERFANGKTWGDAGAYTFMLELIKSKPGIDGCNSFEDIVERYRKLDDAFDIIKHERKLQSRKEINPFTFREHGGIYVHVDRNANFIFGRGGSHRFAIAKILNLESVPVQVGVVHENALSFWRSHVTSSAIAAMPHGKRIADGTLE
jgi:hypothetical protein